MASTDVTCAAVFITRYLTFILLQTYSTHTDRTPRWRTAKGLVDLSDPPPFALLFIPDHSQLLQLRQAGDCLNHVYSYGLKEANLPGNQSNIDAYQLHCYAAGTGVLAGVQVRKEKKVS